jgi:hypothetical protein
MPDQARTITEVARELPPLGEQGRFVDGKFLPKDGWMNVVNDTRAKERDPGHQHVWTAVPEPDGQRVHRAICEVPIPDLDGGSEPCGAKAEWRVVHLWEPEPEAPSLMDDIRRVIAWVKEKVRR